MVVTKDPRVDAYIAKQADFAKPILNWLRECVHTACPEIEETIKWGMPNFYLEGKPLANMAAFKAHAAFGVWDRDVLATGKEGEALGQYGRLTPDNLPSTEAIEAQVRDSAEMIRTGTRPRRQRAEPKGEAEVPEALAEALARDDLAAATFNGFPPGQRREYCEWVAEAKRPDTRDKRVAQAIEWLREGKRRNWKYE
jgi:uncharacterized protein YdeI (YjbR/CyaY-like superfamily)